MDVPRKSSSRNKKIRRIVYALAILIAVPLITVGLARMKPADLAVDHSTVWMDTVKRGPMVREVRGAGTLIPEEVRWVPATTDGQVERVNLQAGVEVSADTVLLVLSNPQLQQEAQDVAWQVKAAEADLAKLKAQLESQRLDQVATTAHAGADYKQAKLRADSDEDLAKKGLIAELPRKLSRVTADELENREKIEQQRLTMASDSAKAQLDAQAARVEQLRALSQLKRSQLDSLTVRAGIPGVLQQVPVQVGQQVQQGVTLAKVARPEKLKAELRIAETQAKDIVVGQSASIDTRNGVVAGHVARVDPAVQQGTVTVDVAFDGALPTGARPDLSVDGTIQIEKLDDVTFVGRPVNAQPNSQVGLFKVIDDGATAVRIPVQLGRSSVASIEVVNGLQAGDKVILSDTSAYDSVDRIHLK